MNVKSVCDTWSAFKGGILLSLAIFLIVGILLHLNVYVWYRFTIRHILALVSPYIASFLLYYVLMRAMVLSPWHRLGLVCCLLLWWFYSAQVWFYYAYQWLPAQQIVFVGKLTPSRKIIFHNRVTIGNVLTLGLAEILCLKQHYALFMVRFQRLKTKVLTLDVSQRLSMHFTRQWIKIVQHNKVQQHDAALELLRYIIAILVNKKNKVAIAEEWRQFKVMASCFSDRNIELLGEEELFPSDWNRSIPAATLLSWLENALDYTPKGPKGWIRAVWQRIDGQLQLQISNAVGHTDAAGHHGMGSALVGQLFEQLVPGQYGIEYTRKEDSFIVLLIVK
ncbi:hypothetical protein HX021_21270 [Sphingobacterium sp. N143]|uniref:hypothetical protein n=1 Tax=Sphingobacterium sp. N143 TaxID=2746727 RepID=UPI0025788A33|nr:hypothetical protein [Sphingobacterium sp. N143]MDM1296823.1 hypothetical protein [Sphingobacterium sp. N143]